MSAPPRRNSVKFSGPMAIDQREADRRPDRIASADPIPEAEDARRIDAEFGDLVEPRRHGGEMRGHRRLAERRDDEGARAAALVIVSCVVKVFDDTMNRVRAGSSVGERVADDRRRRHWRRNARAGRSFAKGASARAAMAGPRSEPPMPILTTSVKGSPRSAAQRARAHRAREVVDLLPLRLDDAAHILAVDDQRPLREIAQRQ